jgi:branched-subunit amino acid ABC-type transport system permease component
VSATDLVNGFLLGGLYVLVALGLSLAFGVMRLINLAHGALVIGAAYLALWLFTEAGLGAFAALPLVVIAAVLFGYLLQRVLLTHLMMQSFLLGIVGTFGLAIIAETAFAVGFTSDPQSLPSALGVAGCSRSGWPWSCRWPCTSPSAGPGPGRCCGQRPPSRGRRSSWASTCRASSGSPWPWPPG